jgi:hypothetical protein
MPKTVKSPKRAHLYLGSPNENVLKDLRNENYDIISGSYDGSGSTKCFTDDTILPKKRAKKGRSKLMIKHKGSRQISAAIKKKLVFD